MKKSAISGAALRREYVKPALRVVKLQGRSCLLQASQMQINSTDPWPTLPGDPTTPLLPW